VAQEVEYLLCKREALSSNSSTTIKKRKERQKTVSMCSSLFVRSWLLFSMPQFLWSILLTCTLVSALPAPLPPGFLGWPSLVMLALLPLQFFTVSFYTALLALLFCLFCGTGVELRASHCSWHFWSLEIILFRSLCVCGLPLPSVLLTWWLRTCAR
jgi:hypothetical protein